MANGLFGRLQNELDARAGAQGITMTDILEMPEPLSTVMNWMVRVGDVSLPDITDRLGQDESRARELLVSMLNKGFVQELKTEGEARYRVRLITKPKRDVSIGLWKALEDQNDK